MGSARFQSRRERNPGQVFVDRSIHLLYYQALAIWPGGRFRASQFLRDTTMRDSTRRLETIIFIAALTFALMSLLLTGASESELQDAFSDPVEQSMIRPRAGYLILVDNFSSCFRCPEAPSP